MPKPDNDRMKELSVIKNRLEKKSEIKQWLEYQGLSSIEKAAREKEWDKYFDNVRNTKSYKRYGKISQLINQGRTADVKEWSKKAREQLEKDEWEIKKPAGVDPKWLRSNQTVSQYRKIMNEIHGVIPKEMDPIV